MSQCSEVTFYCEGIHRPVYLYTTPKAAYVDDITVTIAEPKEDLGM